MDYKNLIKKLEYQADTIRNNNCTTMSAEESEAAANAIKTLLAERNAATEKMRGNCDECVNADTPAQEYPCYFCRFSVYGKNKGTEHWQWRGPQKHD